MASPAGQDSSSCRGTLWTAGIVAWLDMFVLNQGALALLTAVILLIVAVASIFRTETRSVTVLRLVVALSLAPGVLAVNYGQNYLARERADRVVAAIDAYHADHGDYPEALSDLAPVYLPSVPLAKYTLMFSTFNYMKVKDGAILFYVALPPFGRPTYRFGAGKGSWGYID